MNNHREFSHLSIGHRKLVKKILDFMRENQPFEELFVYTNKDIAEAVGYDNTQGEISYVSRTMKTLQSLGYVEGKKIDSVWHWHISAGSGENNG